MVETNASDLILEKIKKIISSLFKRKEIAITLAAFLLGTALGTLVPFFPLSVVGLVLVALGWLSYANALERKIKVLKELWIYVNKAKSKEVMTFYEPESRKKVEEELRIIVNEFERKLSDVRGEIEEIRKLSLKGLVSYSLGVGLLAAELASRCSGYCQAAALVLFSSILLIPLSSMIGHLKDWRVR